MFFESDEGHVRVLRLKLPAKPLPDALNFGLAVIPPVIEVHPVGEVVAFPLGLVAVRPASVNVEELSAELASERVVPQRRIQVRVHLHQTWECLLWISHAHNELGVGEGLSHFGGDGGKINGTANIDRFFVVTFEHDAAGHAALDELHLVVVAVADLVHSAHRFHTHAHGREDSGGEEATREVGSHHVMLLNLFVHADHMILNVALEPEMENEPVHCFDKGLHRVLHQNRREKKVEVRAPDALANGADRFLAVGCAAPLVTQHKDKSFVGFVEKVIVHFCQPPCEEQILKPHQRAVQRDVGQQHE